MQIRIGQQDIELKDESVHDIRLVLEALAAQFKIEQSWPEGLDETDEGMVMGLSSAESTVDDILFTLRGK